MPDKHHEDLAVAVAGGHDFTLGDQHVANVHGGLSEPPPLSRRSSTSPRIFAFAELFHRRAKVGRGTLLARILPREPGNANIADLPLAGEQEVPLAVGTAGIALHGFFWMSRRTMAISRAGPPRMQNGQRDGGARLAANPLQRHPQRQTLRALALDPFDAVAGANAGSKGGTVRQRTEHEDLLRLGIDCRPDPNALDFLVEFLLELPLLGDPDVFRIVVAELPRTCPYIAPSKRFNSSTG